MDSGPAIAGMTACEALRRHSGMLSAGIQE